MGGAFSSPPRPSWCSPSPISSSTCPLAAMVALAAVRARALGKLSAMRAGRSPSGGIRLRDADQAALRHLRGPARPVESLARLRSPFDRRRRLGWAAAALAIARAARRCPGTARRDSSACPCRSSTAPSSRRRSSRTPEPLTSAALSYYPRTLPTQLGPSWRRAAPVGTVGAQEASRRALPALARHPRTLRRLLPDPEQEPPLHPAHPPRGRPRGRGGPA